MRLWFDCAFCYITQFRKRQQSEHKGRAGRGKEGQAGKSRHKEAHGGDRQAKEGQGVSRMDRE